MKQSEATAGGVSQQEVTYRSDELVRTDDEWRTGNRKENVRQSKSPVLGNMQRQIRGGNDMGPIDGQKKVIIAVVQKFSGALEEGGIRDATDRKMYKT